MVYNLKSMTIMAWLLIFSPLLAADQPAQLWLHSGGDSERRPAVLLETDVDIDISGMLGYTLVSQRFVNTSDDWVEGRYLFPLPDDSAVESLRIQIGDRVIEGEIQERGQARQTYRTARDQGRATGLVEQQRANVFTTRVANIAPGETVDIQIGFRQTVRYRNGRFSLFFPTTVAPRFGQETGLGEAVTVPVRDSGQAGERALSLRVELRPGMELAALQSSHHLIETDFNGDRWLITMAGEHGPVSRDFELEWIPDPSRPIHGAVFQQHLGGLDHLLVMMVPPEEFSSDQTPREQILIIDTSGSMRGDPMDQARRSLIFALEKLRPGDRFNVIEFNHRTRALFDEPVAATNANIHRATRFVENLRTGGGTVMGPSLNMAMGYPESDGFIRQIVFITDGLIHNEDEVSAQVHREIGNSRLFNVGIGHGVNSQFLTDLARYGRGTYTRIADLGQINQRMGELIVQLGTPVLHDIELHWPGEAEIYPSRIPDLYTGEPLLVSARGEHLMGDVLVTGLSNGRPWQQEIPMESFQLAGGVAAHWARAGLSSRFDQRFNGADPDLVRESVLDLALEYQLLSPFTSLVAVDRTPARTRQAALRRHDLPTDLPQGRELSGVGSQVMMRAMPATDAGSDHTLLRGALALLLVGLLLGHKRMTREPEHEEERS
jgi:Ca-activated chloride channel homolog